MEAIEGDGIASHPGADLNGDGVVDLVDLEYLTKGSKGDRDILSYIESSLSPAAMQLNLGAGTRVENGNPDDLLENDVPLTLKNEKGVISSESPVELEFNVNAADEDAMSDGIVIETGEDTDITSASFRIEYVDADAGRERDSCGRGNPFSSGGRRGAGASGQKREYRDTPGQTGRHKKGDLDH